ncbi:MFS transporter [Longispora fulva]|uniref:MFS family permease n=1 Tax=Longispora fulva TaxID=619741 RepID=A0A8J7GLJ0_9ACTN|nr:MFS transporter [Longispora fulva]MBG6135224.1 MFS family permease [Longispora fulva]GIG56542.1 MFS transporter [Longispora fulva]
MYVTLDRDARVASRSGRRVAGTVLVLGTVSLVTDVSSEMVTAVLPLYLVLGLGLSPLQFGFLDGLYGGVTALVRLAGGHAADRWQRHKLVAGLGYGLSAFARLGFLVGTVPWLVGALVVDRAGKGIRTAPRDALITLSSPAGALGQAFGVHRAMDTAGALLGPLVAFGILAVASGGYDAVFVVSGGIGAFGVLLLVLFVHEAPRVARAVVARGTAGPAVRRICLTAALLGVVTVADPFVYLVLRDRLALPDGYFPLLPLGTAGLYLALAVPAGMLADRYGRRLVFLAGHGALAAVYALLLSPIAGATLLVAALALHGVFYAATDGVLMALAGPLSDPARRTGTLAKVQTAQALARLGSSVLFGAAWTGWGMTAALAVAAVGLACALVAAPLLLPKEDS